jgi:hypothetical protein
MATPWIPETEQELITGIETGLIRETHRMEVKAVARNDAIAMTLASLAIDGGAFILGIAEIIENGRKRLHPQPLDLVGLPERVDGIARNGMDPPLAVHMREIISETNPGLGYLVMEVDPSPVAPHMVNGAYYGRGESSRHKLPDSDVRRYHQLRRNQEDSGFALLDQEEDRDYLAPNQSREGHLYLVAEPLGRLPAAGEAFLRETRAVHDIISTGNLDFVRDDGGPHPRNAGRIRERNDGTAFVTGHADGPGRTPNPDERRQYGREEAMLDIEVQARGGIRVYLSSATTSYDDTKLVRDHIILAYVRHLLAWITALEGKTQYNGPWLLGVRVTQLRGHRSIHKVKVRDATEVGSMDTDKYSRVTIATMREVRDHPGNVAADLLGDLIRVLGTAKENKLGA